MRNFIKTGGHHDEKRNKTISKKKKKKIRQKLYRKSRSIDF